MVFSSNYFLTFFLPFFLVIYFLIGKRLKNGFILAASLYFFSWGAPKFVFLLLGTTIMDFYLVRWMSLQTDARKRKQLLILSLSVNLGLLVVFKYANFFVENLNEALDGMGMRQLQWTSIALPIGISFFVFESITYAVDVYRKTQRPLEYFTDYLLYILLFPKLIMGPIIPYRVIADQIRDRSAFETTDNRLNGLFRFCTGLAKKVLIADQLGAYTDRIFAGNFETMDTFSAWIGIVGFAMQLYFDFSGYSDMAIGLSKTMGFNIPENFNRPFTSASITEFWTRWHISLGNWMREYLYIPLGGNRVARPSRLYLNLGIVFLVSGFWHGASWNFIIWGLFHGFFIISERVFLLRFYQFTGKWFSIPFTFLIVVIGCVFFRIAAASDSVEYLHRLFTSSPKDSGTFEFRFYLLLVVALVLSFVGVTRMGRSLEQWWYAHRTSLSGQVLFAGISVVLLVLSLAYVESGTFHPFIYFQF